MILEFMAKLWNWIDIIHFLVMWWAWWLWLSQNYMAANLQSTFPSKFSILKTPTDDTIARRFLTDAEEEFKFLEFSQNVNAMAGNLAMYNVLVSTNGCVI